MDAERRLDVHLAQSLDALLSLASAAAAAGRPELALAANAALDPLVPFLTDTTETDRPDLWPDAPTDRRHADH